MCIKLLGVWDGAKGWEKRDVESTLRLNFIFHIIIMVCICQIWRLDHVLVDFICIIVPELQMPGEGLSVIFKT
jgi:hypothetical protein